MRLFKKGMGIMLAASMLASLCACGNSSGSQTTESVVQKENYGECRRGCFFRTGHSGFIYQSHMVASAELERYCSGIYYRPDRCQSECYGCGRCTAVTAYDFFRGTAGFNLY